MEPWQALALVAVVAAVTAAVMWWLARRPFEMSSSFDARIVGYSLWRWDGSNWVSIEDSPKPGHIAPPPPDDPSAIPSGHVVRVLAKQR